MCIAYYVFTDSYVIHILCLNAILLYRIARFDVSLQRARVACIGID